MKKYIIISTKHRGWLDNGVLFWGKDRSGYKHYLNEVGLYSKEEAMRIYKETHGSEVPIDIDYLKLTPEDFKEHGYVKKIYTI